jgi:hypothetical protein
LSAVIEPAFEVDDEEKIEKVGTAVGLAIGSANPLAKDDVVGVDTINEVRTAGRLLVSANAAPAVAPTNSVAIRAAAATRWTFRRDRGWLRTALCMTTSATPGAAPTGGFA